MENLESPNPIAYYFADWCDENTPCAPTLEASADWLSRPDHDWSRPAAATCGDTFRMTREEVLGDVVATYDGNGKWTLSAVPEGVEWCAVRDCSGPFGWDAEDSYDSVAGLLALHDGTDPINGGDAEPGDTLTLICTRSLPEAMVRYDLTATGPALAPLTGIDALTPDQLRDEVRYWREEHAAMLQAGMIEDRLAKGDGRSRAARLPRLRQMVRAADLLAKALCLDVAIEHCEACAGAIRIGDRVYANTDGGSLHARCMGDPTSGEGFVDADLQPLPPGAPAPEPHVYGPLYSHDRMAEVVVEATAYLLAEKAPAR